MGAGEPVPAANLLPWLPLHATATASPAFGGFVPQMPAGCGARSSTCQGLSCWSWFCAGAAGVPTSTPNPQNCLCLVETSGICCLQ